MHACGADAVPLAFGFHPYLSLPGAPRERWLVELPAMRHLALDAQADSRSARSRRSRPERFELAEREFDDGFDAVAEPARFGVAAAGRRIELEFLRGLSLRAGVRAARRAVHLLRADDRARQRAAQRRGPAPAGAGRAVPRGVLGAGRGVTAM